MGLVLWGQAKKDPDESGPSLVLSQRTSQSHSRHRIKSGDDEHGDGDPLRHVLNNQFAGAYNHRHDVARFGVVL